MTSRTIGQSGGRVRSVVLVDPIAFNNMMTARNGDMRRVMSGLASTATVEARQLADSRLEPGTGRYKRSIKSRLTAHAIRIEADVPYAATLELGSRPHPIVANVKPLLYFWWEKMGVQFRGKSVWHPGNEQPKMILTDAVSIAARKIGLSP